MTMRRQERLPSDPEALTEALQAASRLLDDRQEVRIAFFHGSAARGLPFRDLDVALIVDRSAVRPEDDVRYALTTADELSQVLGLPVDVRVANDAPPAFRDRVARGTLLLRRSDAEVARFEERAWDDWFDFRPVARAHLETLCSRRSAS